MEPTSAQVLSQPDILSSNLKQDEEIISGNKRELEDEKGDDVQKKFKGQPGVRKKKVAVLLSYCGQGYWGMQRHKPSSPYKTIEEDLLTALLKAELINQTNFEVPQTCGFQRAARTDKGVSAARQVVSIRIAYEENLKDKVNQYLPPVIRIQSVKKATKGFNSKYWCDARTYSYTLPTFAFASSTSITNENYRIDETTIEKINVLIKSFMGTHNFYNFTRGKKFNDPSAKRYMMNLECGQPFVEDGMEMIVITIKGQSFMLHQIRKMMGIVIAILRDLATFTVLEKVWNAERLDIPVAPGLGLVLEEVHYDKYNQRYSKDGIHEALVWDDIKDEIEEFKRQHIYLPIIKAEKETKSMFNWLETLPLHTYGVRPPSGFRRTAFGDAKVLVDPAEAENSPLEDEENVTQENEENITQENENITQKNEDNVTQEHDENVTSKNAV